MKISFDFFKPWRFSMFGVFFWGLTHENICPGPCQALNFSSLGDSWSVAPSCEVRLMEILVLIHVRAWVTVDLWDLRLQSDSYPTSPPQCHMVITALPCSTTFPCQQLHPPPPFDSLRYRHIACILPCLSLVSLPYRTYVLSKKQKNAVLAAVTKNSCPLFLTPHSSPRPSPVPTCAYFSILHPSLSSLTEPWKIRHKWRF